MPGVRMTGRSVTEAHRTSTPLELLFDLTFVVAVAQAAAQLAHGIEEGHVASAVVSYLMVFFAIWWAWMSFSWFASAYDTDDVPYRLLTLVQMAGVLVLAAGVPAAFGDRDFTAVVVGYVVMRLATVSQWLRAASSDPEHRRIAHGYALGITVLQVGWVLRLLLPGWLGVVGFVVLAAGELAVPWWAERRDGGMTTWHPHHIAERYGLFTIIVLGESVLAATVALQATIADGGWSADLLLTGAGSLLVLFSLWWFYFLKDAAQLLERRRDFAFFWGYGHFGVFASVAALGAGLEVAAADVGSDVEASTTLVAGSLAVPVAVFLLLGWLLHSPGSPDRRRQLARVAAACAGCAVVVALTAAGLALPWAVLLMAVPPSALVGWGVRHERNRRSSDTGHVGVSDGT